MGNKFSFIDKNGIREVEALLGMNISYGLDQLERDLEHQLPDAYFSRNPSKELTIVHPTSETPDGRLIHYTGNVVRYDIKVDPVSKTVVLTVDPTGVPREDYRTEKKLMSLRRELLRVNAVNSIIDESLRDFAVTNGFWYDSPFNRRGISEGQL